MADAIQRITSDLKIPYIFKASYDKANRTSVKSFRGPGLVEGTRILGALAKATGLPVLTDVHEPGHCEIAAEAVDVLQIPAFLACFEQTDLAGGCGQDWAGREYQERAVRSALGYALSGHGKDAFHRQ